MRRPIPVIVAAIAGLTLGSALGAGGTALLMAFIAGFLAWLFTRGPGDRRARESRSSPAVAGSPIVRVSEEIPPVGKRAASAPGTPDPAVISNIDYAMKFLADARRQGVVSRSTYVALQRLLELRKQELLPAPATVTPATAVPAAPAAAAPAVQRPAPAPPPIEPAPTPRRAAPERPGVEAPRPAAPPRRPAVLPREPVISKWMAATGRQAGERLRKVWRALASDFALHSLTYIGVLLAVVVVFVFFAFGYFGDVVSEPTFRPVVEAAIPVFFFGLAWILRRWTGIPHTAAAVGLIGALTLPVMMSATFQDGASFPPDIDPPARWFAYAAVAVICAAVYSVLAIRFQPSAYAYLVGPVLWASFGALGLFLRDGISAWQMVLVMAGMTASVPVAGALRERPLGKVVSAPIVQTAGLSLPVLLVVALAFAYQDAVAAGAAAPSLRDLAPAGIGAAVVAAIGFVLVGRLPFAWAGLTERLRRETAEVLTILAYLSLAAAWVFGAALGLQIGWVGVSLLGLSAVIYTLESRAKRWTRVGPWAIRVAVAAGLLLSLADGFPTLVAWGLVAALVGAAILVPSFRERVTAVAPFPRDRTILAVALWTPTLVALVGGATRAWPRGSPWLLATGAILLGGARFLPPRAEIVRSLASVPAIAVGLAAIVVGIYRFSAGSLIAADERLGPLAFGVLLGMVAAAAALVDQPWMARLPAVAALGAGSLLFVLRDLIGDSGDRAALADTLALGLVGALLFADSLVRFRSRDGQWNGLIGHLLVYAAWARGLAAEPATILGLSLLVASHGAEALAVERWSSPLVSWLGRIAPRLAAGVAAAPALVAAAALPFLAVLVGRHLEVIRSERPRSGLVLSALSWVYVGGAAALRRSERLRRVMTAGTYLLSGAGIAVVAPSLTGSVLAVGSAAAATGVLAWVFRRPSSTMVTWVLALVFEILLLLRLGLGLGDLHLALFATAIAMMVVPPVLDRFVRSSQEPGLRSAWLQPPVALGLLVLPVSLAVALADGRLVAVMGLGAAAAYALLGWLVGTWGMTVPVCAMIGMAYPDFLDRWASPFAEPILWMPLAAGFVLASMALPGRRSWRVLDDPSPALVVAGFATSALALVLTLREAGTGNVLLSTSAVLALVFLSRRHQGWLYASLAALFAGGTAHGQGWSAAAAAFDAVALGALATSRRARPEAFLLIVVTTALVGYAYASLAWWAEWSSGTTMLVTGVLAVVVGFPATALSVRGPAPDPVRVWLPSAHALAHLAAASVVIVAAVSDPDMRVSLDDLGGSVIRLVVTALVGTGPGTLVFLGEAVLLGALATARPSRPWTAWAVGGATVFLALAYAGVIRLADVDVRTAMTITGAASAALAAGGTMLSFRTRVPGVARLWLPSTHWLAQAGVGSVLLVAFATLPDRSPWVVVALVSVAEGIFLGAHVTMGRRLFGPLGVLAERREGGLAATTLLTALAYGSLAYWAEAEPATLISVTGLGSAALALAAVLVTVRERVLPSLRLWLLPAHALAQAGAAVSVLMATTALPSDRALGVFALASAAEAVYVGALASRISPLWYPREVAGVLLVAAAIAGTLALDPLGGGALVAIYSVAAGGLGAWVVAGLARDRLAEWERPTLILGSGLGLAAVGLAGALFGPFDRPTLLALAFVGADLVSHGALTQRYLVLEAGLLVWFGSAMLFGREFLGANRHAYVVPTSVILLAVLEVERGRLRRRNAEIPDPVKVAEWLLMIVPVGLATVSLFGSVGYALLLAAEGGALLAWGIVSKVRRRALVGLAGVTLAVVLSAGVPIVNVLQAGVSGTMLLVLGAVLAVVLIVVGSVLERNLGRIRGRIRRVGEIVEDWE